MLDGVGGQLHALATFAWQRDLVPIVQHALATFAWQRDLVPIVQHALATFAWQRDLVPIVQHALATFAWQRDLVPIVQEAGWAAEPVWTGAENLAPFGIRSLYCPARSKPLYQLSNPTHMTGCPY